MKILITVDTGPYKDVYDADMSQNEINWWDEKDSRALYCTESFLAIDLCSQLKKVVREVAINRDDIQYDMLIKIGKENRQADCQVNETGFLISSMVNGIRTVELYGEKREGSINAVYEFLFYLGFRYYNTDNYSVIAPKTIKINDFNRKVKPDFVTRGCYNSFTDDSYFSFIEWMTRNRMNMLKVQRYQQPCELKKRGIKILSGGHEIFYHYLNPNMKSPYHLKGETYFEVHPEWFAEIGGKRSSRDENLSATEGYYTGDNICTSNVDGLKELSKNVITALSDGDLRYCDLLNFWAYDNGAWCECENCIKIGNYATRMLMAAYFIDKEIKIAIEENRIGRNVKIIVPVYHETLIPPVDELPEDFDYENIIITFFPIERCYTHYFDDSNCTETNIHLKKLFEKWAVDSERKYKGEIFIGEYFNVSSFASMPFVFTDKITHDLKYYYDNHSRHFYYMHISMIEWGMLTLNNYLIAKLLWDINANKNDILEEYYRNVYHKSTVKMKRFHYLLEEASSNSKYLKHYQFDQQGIKKPSLMWNMFDDKLFPLKHCRFDNQEEDSNAGISFTETMAIYEKCRLLIKEIEKECSHSEKKAVAIEKMRFEYGYLVFSFLFHLVKLRFAHLENNIDIMKKEFKNTENLKDILMSMKRPIDDAKYECTPWLSNAFHATWVGNRYIEYSLKVKEHLNQV